MNRTLGETYLFRHAVFRAASLPSGPETAKLSLKVLDYLPSLCSRRNSHIIADLAAKARRAGVDETDHARLLDLEKVWLRRAIEVARNELRNDEERELRRRYAALPNLTSNQRVQALLEAAVACDTTGESQQAQSLATSALELARGHGLKLAEIKALNELGLEFRYAGDYGRSSALLREALEIAEEHKDEVLIAKSALNWAATLRGEGKPDEALKHCERAARLYRANGDLAGASRALHLKARILRIQGLIEDALESLRDAISIDELNGDLDAQARSTGNLALLLSDAGDKRAGLAEMQRALSLFISVGRRPDIAQAMANISAMLIGICNYQTALKFSIDGERLCREYGLRAPLALCLMNRGIAELKLGQTKNAAETIGAAERLIDSASDYVRRFDIHFWKSALKLKQQNLDDALSLVSHAELIAKESSDLNRTARALRLKADILREANRGDDAHACILDSLECFDQAGASESSDYLKCVVLAARIEAMRGNRQDAQFLARDGTELLHRLDVGDARADPDFDIMLKQLDELNAGSPT